MVVTPPARLVEPDDVIDCGNSGTSLRLLAGVLAGVPGLSVLTGDASLRRRPVRRVVEPLRRMGGVLEARDGDRLPPLVIRGQRLRGTRHVLAVASAQVKSAILLAGLSADGETVVEEPALSRDHTERMLRRMGADLSRRRAPGHHPALGPARGRGGRARGHLVGGLLPLRRGGAPRLRGDRAGPGDEPHPHRPARRAARHGRRRRGGERAGERRRAARRRHGAWSPARGGDHRGGARARASSTSSRSSWCSPPRPRGAPSSATPGSCG